MMQTVRRFTTQVKRQHPGEQRSQRALVTGDQLCINKEQFGNFPTLSQSFLFDGHTADKPLPAGQDKITEA